MIGKIRKGKSFAGLTKYILEKDEAQLICTNLAGDTPQDFYQQLSATRSLNPRVKSPVSHISISFPPTEKPDKEQLQEIVEETLAEMGFEKNLYFAASHNDRNHFHLHIAASRINIDGECVSDWYDKRRLEKVLRNLESQFDLTPVPSSWEVDTTAPSTGQKRRMMREKREFDMGIRDKEAEKSAVEKIQDAIENVIQPGIALAQFIEKLELLGVETSIKISDTAKIQGISYSIDDVAFPGRKLGRNSKACTIEGLVMRGVDFDIESEALTATQDADTSEKKAQKGLEIKPNPPQHQRKSQIEMD
jgi:Relaxase/Mobilisation nuclease domain